MPPVFVLPPSNRGHYALIDFKLMAVLIHALSSPPSYVHTRMPRANYHTNRNENDSCFFSLSIIFQTPSPVTEVTRGIDATSSPTLRTAAPAAVQAIDTDAPTSAPTGGLGLEGNGATGLLSGLSVAGVVGTVVISAVFTGALQARMFV